MMDSLKCVDFDYLCESGHSQHLLDLSILLDKAFSVLCDSGIIEKDPNSPADTLPILRKYLINRILHSKLPAEQLLNLLKECGNGLECIALNSTSGQDSFWADVVAYIAIIEKNTDLGFSNYQSASDIKENIISRLDLISSLKVHFTEIGSMAQSDQIDYTRTIGSEFPTHLRESQSGNHLSSSEPDDSFPRSSSRNFAYKNSVSYVENKREFASNLWRNTLDHTVTPIRTAEFNSSTDSSILSVGSNLGEITLYNMDTITRKRNFTHSDDHYIDGSHHEYAVCLPSAHIGSVFCTEWIDSSHFVTGSNDQKINIWNLESDDTFKGVSTAGTIDVNMGTVRSISKCNRTKGVIYSISYNDTRLRTWDLIQGEEISSGMSSSDLITKGMCVHSTSLMNVALFYSMNDGTIAAIDTRREKVLWKSPNDLGSGNFLSSDENIVCCAFDRGLRYWDLRMLGAPLGTFQHLHTDAIRCVRLIKASNGTQIFVTSSMDRTAKLIDSSGTVLWSRSYDDRVTFCAVTETRNGYILVCTTGSGVVESWFIAL